MLPKINPRDDTIDFCLSKFNNLEEKCCPFWVWFSNILNFFQIHFTSPIPIRISNNLAYRMYLFMVYLKITCRPTNFITLPGLMLNLLARSKIADISSFANLEFNKKNLTRGRRVQNAKISCNAKFLLTTLFCKVGIISW